MTTPTIGRVNALALAAAAAAATVAAGCESAPSCDKAIARAAEIRDLDKLDADQARRRCSEGNWSGALRTCVAAAKDEDDLEACAAKARRRESSGGHAGYMKKAKASEAELNLRALERSIKTHYAENAAFPEGQVGPTPAAGSCCDSPGKKCQADPSLWREPVWEQLDFSVDQPSYFSYRYLGATGQTAFAEAIGDLDCDGDLAVYKLSCDTLDGSPRCELSRPERPD
jgi:hypothetical protein